MNDLLKKLDKRPELYEQTETTIWNDPHISKGMLNAHLIDSLDSATRNLKFVKKSVKWISSIEPPKAGIKLLDLGCGPGIYMELFFEKGYQVTGIDVSKRSIAYATKSANKKGLSIKYLVGDYTNIDFKGQYNVITLIYCDFGVLAPDIRSALLKKAHHMLLPNGVLIFDVFTPLKYKNTSENNSWEICENGFWNEKLCITFTSFYRYEEDSTFLNKYTVVTKDNEIFEYNVWEHTFTIKELKKDLMYAGFHDVEFYGNVIGDVCMHDDETIGVVAKKKIE